MTASLVLKEPGKARSRVDRAYAPSWAVPPVVDQSNVPQAARVPTGSSTAVGDGRPTLDDLRDVEWNAGHDHSGFEEAQTIEDGNLTPATIVLPLCREDTERYTSNVS
jgi:hypothetical protein